MEVLCSSGTIGNIPANTTLFTPSFFTGVILWCRSVHHLWLRTNTKPPKRSGYHFVSNNALLLPLRVCPATAVERTSDPTSWPGLLPTDRLLCQ